MGRFIFQLLQVESEEPVVFNILKGVIKELVNDENDTRKEFLARIV